MPTTQPLCVTLEAARTVVAGALAHARGNDLPPMTVAVLDAAGQLIAFARQDRSSLLRERIARGNANVALNLGVGSRSLAARAAAHPAFINSVVALTDSGLVPAADGVLVRDDGDDVIGAVGVSGSLPDDDEACAVRHRRRGATRQRRSLTQPFPVSRSTTHGRIPSQRWHVAHSAG